MAHTYKVQAHTIKATKETARQEYWRTETKVRIESKKVETWPVIKPTKGTMTHDGYRRRYKQRVDEVIGQGE